MNYVTGNSAIQRAKEERAKANKLHEHKGMWRYRLKKGERGGITFLDVPTKGTYEHSVKKSNGFYEAVWCTNNENNEGSCPHCAAGIPRSYVLVGTVINHNSYPSKDGSKTYKDQKQYIVLKGRGQLAMLEFLDPESPEHVDVKYKVFSVKRPDEQTSTSCGEIFTLKGKTSSAKLKTYAPSGEDPDEFIKPFDYSILFNVVDTKPLFDSEASGIGTDDDPFEDLVEEDEEAESLDDDNGEEDESVKSLF